MKKAIPIIAFIILLINTAIAQKFTAQASKTKVAVGEQFQITFTLNSNGGDFQPPSLSNFDVYSGPNQSSSMSFVNGNMSQSVSLSYIIAAKKEGKLTIGPATVNANGNSLQSNSITIEVVKGNASAGQGSANTQQQSAVSSENVSDNLFVRTIVDKTKAYQGEQITVTHKVYTRYQLLGFQDIKFPDYNGFWAQEVPSNQQIQLSNENIDGVTYQVGELKRTYIFAQRSGKMEIEPMSVECVIRRQSNRRPRDIFEQFFGGGYEDAKVAVKSKPVSIDIKPLPEAGKPEGFSGAVGNYSFKANINKDKVKANDAINLSITLSGKGNIKLVTPPVFEFPADFETYEPKLKENISTGGGSVNGSKTFDYLIIPRHEGDYTIDKLNFSYFDPEKKEYVVLPSPEFNIHVDKGRDDNASVNIISAKNKEDVKILGNDIRHIKTNSFQLHPKDNYFYGSGWFYTGLLSPILAFIGFIIVRKKQEEENKDSIAVKSRKAAKLAKKHLSVAESHLNTNNKELFYIEILKAIYGYIGDRFNISAAELNKEHIAQTLKNKQVDVAVVQQLLSLIDSCEFARYAPSAASADLKSIYNSSTELIIKIEDGLK